MRKFIKQVKCEDLKVNIYVSDVLKQGVHGQALSREWDIFVDPTQQNQTEVLETLIHELMEVINRSWMDKPITHEQLTCFAEWLAPYLYQLGMEVKFHSL